MEAYLGEVLLRHRQYIARVGQIDITTNKVLRHELRLTLLEVLELCRVIAFDPACLVEADRLPATGCTIFVE